MKIEFDGDAYHVSFKNVSEKIIHDSLPAPMRETLLESGLLQPVHDRKTIRYRLHSAFKRYLTLKAPRRISTATTICTITGPTGDTLATGRAYYSKTEPVFNYAKARAKAFGRALHALTSVLPVDAFAKTYNLAVQERQDKVARSRGAASTAHSSDARLHSAGHHSAVVQQPETPGAD